MILYFLMPIFFCECFSGGGGVFNELLYIDGVGIKTWLKKNTWWAGYGGGDFEIKIDKINNFLCFI